MTYFVLFFIALIAFTITIIAGGGAGLLLIPLIGVFLPATQVPAALTIGTLTSSISKFAIFHKLVDKRISKAFIPASLPGVALGAWLLTHINTNLVELFIGLFLVANLPLIFLSGKKNIDYDATQKEVSLFHIMFIGFLAGLVSALIGAVGVLFNRFYYRCGLDKDEVVANRAANEIVLHLFKIILYTSMGLINLEVFIIGVVLAVAAIIVALASKAILKKLSSELFKRIGHIAMTVSGIIMLYSASVNIITENNPQLRLKYLEDGIDGQLHWSSVLYTVEFRYHEGLEIELPIRFEELPMDMQKTYAYLLESYLLTIEKVYTFQGVGYEIYIFDHDHKLLKKIDHDQH
jgi:uncharacterized protein